MPTKKFIAREHIFHSIDTPNKAYWFGFLCADGNVDGKGRTRIRLALQEQDRHHVIAFQQFVGSSCVVGRSNHNSYELSFSSKFMHRDLIAHGCTPVKSKTLKYPEFLINTELERHFIRGYFDGDGSITHYVKYGKYISPRVSFTTGSVDFADALMERLQQFKPIRKVRYDKGIFSVMAVTCSGYTQTQAIYDYMYAGATIFLKRKHDKFIELLAQKKPEPVRYRNAISEQVVSLYKEGTNVKDIAEQLGVGKSTVYRVLEDADVKRPDTRYS
jgi:hypothetical protein